MFVCQKLDVLNLYAIRTILAGFVESSYRTCFIGRIGDYIYFWICHIMTSIPLISCFLVLISCLMLFEHAIDANMLL